MGFCSNIRSSIVAVCVLVGALALVLSPAVLREHHKKGKLTTHARSQALWCLQALHASLSEELVDLELVIPSQLPTGKVISMSDSIVSEIARSYKHRVTNTSPGTNITDNWGTTISSQISFQKCITNAAGGLRGVVVIHARSLGPNRQDDNGGDDDLDLEDEATVPNVILAEQGPLELRVRARDNSGSTNTAR